MAADEINQGGGINGQQIDVVIEDDKGSPESAAQLTGRLIDNYKVVAIIGAGASGNSLGGGAQSAVSQSTADRAVFHQPRGYAGRATTFSALATSMRSRAR